MEGYGDEAAEFPAEQVEESIGKHIPGTLGSNPYNARKVNEWTNQIVAMCLKDLQQLAKPFKYIITCIISQKNGAGLVTSSSTYWDAGKDNCVHVNWGNDTMTCIVCIYGICVHIDDPQEMDM
jgi:dynein light chain Tctex-type 1